MTLGQPFLGLRVHLLKRGKGSFLTKFTKVRISIKKGSVHWKRRKNIGGDLTGHVLHKGTIRVSKRSVSEDV